MSFTISNATLSKMKGLPTSINNLQNYPIISEVEDYTVEAVNDLLERERYEYVFTINGERIDVLDNEYAFEFTIQVIQTDSGEEIEVAPNMHLEYIWDNIRYKWIDYKDAVILSKKYVWIIDREKVQSKKPEKWVPYHKVDNETHRDYIITGDLDQDRVYRWAKLSHVSLMEITSLSWLTWEEEQLDFLGKYFDDEVFDSPDFLWKINSFYEEAIDIFKDRSTYLAESSQFRKFNNIIFENKESILEFLNSASSENTNRRIRTIHCTLLKYIYLLNEYEKNGVYNLLKRLETWWENVKIEFIKNLFHLPQDTDVIINRQELYQFVKTIWWVEVIVTFRIKSIKSIINKSLAKWEYLKLEDFNDTFAASYYIPEYAKADNVAIMKKVDEDFYNWRWYLKNKWFVTHDMLNLDDHSRANKKYIKASKNAVANKWWSDKYSDAKHTWYHVIEEWWESLQVGFESKYFNWTPDEDTNEIGMSFHPVYEHFSKYFEAEANRQPFITAENLAARINSLYVILWDKSILYKYWKQRIDVLREIHSELTATEHSSSFPESESWGKLKNFFENVLSEMIFKKLIKKYWLERARIWGKTCFTSKYNREQLQAWLRWYEFAD